MKITSKNDTIGSNSHPFPHMLDYTLFMSCTIVVSKSWCALPVWVQGNMVVYLLKVTLIWIR